MFWRGLVVFCSAHRCDLRRLAHAGTLLGSPVSPMFKIALMFFLAMAPAGTSPLPVNADPERLAAHVKRIVAHGPRDAPHVENLAAVADHVAAELRAHGARVSEQGKPQGQRAISPNIRS